MAVVTPTKFMPLQVPGYEVNDTGQAKVDLTAGQLLIITDDNPTRVGFEKVFTVAPTGTIDAAGICLQDVKAGGTAEVGIQGEGAGYSNLVRGGGLYPSGTTAGRLDTTPTATPIIRVRAIAKDKIRYSFV